MSEKKMYWHPGLEATISVEEPAMNRDKLLELAKEAGHPYPEADADFFERFAALLSQQEQEPEWYTGVDGHGCRRFYHKEEVRPGIGFDECLYLAPPHAQGCNEAIELIQSGDLEPILFRAGEEDARMVLYRARQSLARPSQAQEPNIIDFHNGDAAMWIEDGKVKAEWNTSEPVASGVGDELERQVAELRKELQDIRDMTDADNPESYRSDDREGCLDTVFAKAAAALAQAKKEGS